MSLANIKKVDKMDNPTPTPQPHKIIWHHLQQKITEIVKNPYITDLQNYYTTDRYPCTHTV
jgi:hypothetical protein